MAIVYLGRIQELAHEVEEATEVLDNRYREIFGHERAEKLKEIGSRVLIPESFFDDKEAVYRSLGERFEENAPNRMIFASGASYEVAPNGRIKDRKVQTAVAFYIAEEAFKHSGSSKFTERMIASYVHEFNHFVWYALQKVPLYLATRYMHEAKYPKPSNPNQGLKAYIEEMDAAGIPPSQITHNLTLSLAQRALKEIFEAGNRILDKMVLDCIGIDVPLEWRNQEKTYYPFPLPTGIVIVGGGGDPYRGLTDIEAIERFLSWEYYFGGIHGSGFLNNLMDSLKQIKVSRVSIKQVKENIARRNKGEK